MRLCGGNAWQPGRDLPGAAWESLQGVFLEQLPARSATLQPGKPG